jgi:hypothetical protein
MKTTDYDAARLPIERGEVVHIEFISRYFVENHEIWWFILEDERRIPAQMTIEICARQTFFCVSYD